MADPTPGARTLEEIRAAFDGDSVPRKNILLRRAHDEIATLREQLAKVKAERDEARDEAYALKLAAAGGEDAPGSAEMVTAQDVDRWREQHWSDLRAAEARAKAAEAETARMRAALTAERIAAEIQVRWNALVGPAQDGGRFILGWRRHELCAQFGAAVAKAVDRAALSQIQNEGGSRG